MSHPDVRELLHHEPPMLLLDRVVSFETDSVVCEAEPSADWPFMEQSQLDAVVLLEVMAQTVGCYVTLERRAREGSTLRPRTGYLVAAQGVRLHAPSLVVGERVAAHARLEWHDAGLARFWCTATTSGRVLGEGRLTVYERPPAEVG